MGEGKRVSGREAEQHTFDNRKLPVGEALGHGAERHATTVLVACMFVWGVHLLWRNSVKWLWFDELFTANLAQQSSWRAYWAGLAADGNPPLYSALVWASLHLFGVSPLALRLPSLLAYFAATILLYRVVSIRLGRLSGLLAAVLFNVNMNVNVYAIEARPYALVSFFTIAAFASWQMTTDEHKPCLWAQWTLAASLAGAILSHHYGIFNAGLPVLAGEIARSIQRRRVDWRLAARASTGLAALVITIPLARRTQHTLLQYVNYPRGLPRSLQAADYGSMLSIPQFFLAVPLLVIALCLLVALWKRERGTRSLASLLRWPVHEAVALLGSALTLLLVYVMSSMTSGYFAGLRYGIGAYFGIAALTATIYALLHKQAQAVLVLVLMWPMVKEVPEKWSLGFTQGQASACLRALPMQPIVMAQALGYVPAWHYADPALRARLFYLTDWKYARRQLYNVPELAMIAQKPIFPMTLVDYEQFLKSHRNFLVIGSGIAVQDYPIDHLRQDGFQFTPFVAPECAAQQVYQVQPR